MGSSSTDNLFAPPLATLAVELLNAAAAVTDDPLIQIRVLLGSLTDDQRMTVINQLGPEDRAKLFDLMPGQLLPSQTTPLLPGNSYHGNVVETPPNPMDDWIEYQIHRALLLYVPLVIYTVGVVGNVLSFGVLTSRRMRHLSAYAYLAVLAVADCLVLTVGLLLVWIERVTGTDVKDQATWLCRAATVVGYTVSDYSVWLIVAVTVERYIVVCHPLRAAVLCQRRTALRVAAAILLLVLMININFAWTTEVRLPNGVPGANFTGQRVDSTSMWSSASVQRPTCTAARDYDHLVIVVWPWIDAVVYSFAPFTALVVLNALITRQVVSARRRTGGDGSKKVAFRAAPATAPAASLSSGNRRLSSSTPGILMTSRFTSGANADRFSGRLNAVVTPPTSRRLLVSSSRPTCGGCLTESNAVQLGLILAMITVAFLVTTLPMNVVMIVKAFWDVSSKASDDTSTTTSPSVLENDQRMAVRLNLARAVSELLMYTNHSINFFLYCAAGEKFRRELAAIGRRVCRRLCRQPPTSISATRNQDLSTVALDNQSNVVMMAVVTTAEDK